jgi:integrase
LVAAASWGVLPSTAAKNMSVVKAFFEFCHANEWTPRNPARMVRNQRGQHNDPRSEQKLPFSDEELKRMYDACDTKYGKREIQFSKATKERKEQGPYAQYRTRWTGQDIADFISVSVYTGLRISDVSTFHIDRMRPDGTIQLRTTKAHTHVYTWVPEWLQQRTRTRALETGPYIFGKHSTTDMNVITDLWRRKLNKLWEL